MASNPTQYAHKEDERANINCIDDPHRGDLFAEALHIKDPERDQEEGEVADQEYQPGGFGAPPHVIPGKGIERVQDDLHDDAKDRTGDSEEKAVRHPQDFQALLDSGFRRNDLIKDFCKSLHYHLFNRDQLHFKDEGAVGWNQAHVSLAIT